MSQKLRQYFDDLSRVNSEVLNKKEERELSKRVKEGDQEAKEQLVEHNLRLVLDVAKDYKNLGLDYADLIQAGNIGLLKAVNKFDHTLDNKFSTYAYWWIRQSILRALNKHSRTVKVPAHMTRLKREIGRIKRDYKKREGREPTINELADETDEPKDKMRRAILSGTGTKSLNRTLGERDEGKTLAEVIEEKREDTPDEKGEAELTRNRLSQLMDEKLRDRERQVLRLRYGLDDYQPRTLKEVGDVFDLSAESIRQIQNRALEKLKRADLKPKPILHG